MSGRAGRRGKDERGIVVLIIDERMSPATAKEIVKVRATCQTVRSLNSYRLSAGKSRSIEQCVQIDVQHGSESAARGRHQSRVHAGEILLPISAFLLDSSAV